MGKKVVFIAFSDVHVEDRERFSTNHARLGHSLKAVEIVGKAAKEYKCPILFCGDFFDNPKELSNLVISSAFMNYAKWAGDTKLYGISGNHDQSESNSITHKSPSHLDLYDFAFQNFHLLDHGLHHDHGPYRIQGIPYLKANKGFVEKVKYARKNLGKEKKNILLVHTDFHNIAHSKYYKSGTVENLPRRLAKLFKGFDLVLSGHIHKPQIIRDNIVMLGATNHQTVADVGVNMGYWLIYNDLSYKFVEIDNLPKFKHGEDKKDGNFYLPKRKTKSKEKLSTTKSFVGSTSIAQLSRNYLTVTNNKSKKKLRILKKYLIDGFS